VVILYFLFLYFLFSKFRIHIYQQLNVVRHLSAVKRQQLNVIFIFIFILSPVTYPYEQLNLRINLPAVKRHNQFVSSWTSNFNF